jgi:hypothetical protein
LRFRATETGLLGVPASQHVGGVAVQPLEDLADLRFAQRLVEVVPVTEFDSVFLEEGDRLPTGTSGLAADELHHARLLAHAPACVGGAVKAAKTGSAQVTHEPNGWPQKKKTILC